MISRFQDLFNPAAKPESIEWQDLFAEFSTKRPFMGNSHPGWSAAEFEPPRRALENVKAIHALVLDYDNKTADGDRSPNPVTIEAISEALGDYYGLIHTTRHHTPDWPRFRVILPLSRPINRIEYTQLWQTAARLWPGLDPQPKDASRFWFTPGVNDYDASTFEAHTLTGAYLNPDEFIEQKPLLAKPITKAPGSNREARARAYIEKMPEAVSGQGGHEALWKVARKLVCDFGLDESAALRILQTEYNPRCRPQWSDKELQHKVKQAATKAHTVNPIEDRPMPQRNGVSVQPLHSGAPAGTTAVSLNENWQKNLRYNQNGQLTKDIGNVHLILKNESAFAGCLQHNVMTSRAVWYRSPDFDVGIEPPAPNTELNDHHINYVRHVLARCFGLSIGKDDTWAAIEGAAKENPVHPVQEYLNSLQWDGKRRVAYWLHAYLNAEDSEYNAAVGRWWLISAVARAYRPGCQVDHALILEGRQGEGKSQAIRVLGGQWTLGSLPDIRDRDRAAATIGGKWIIEIAELDALKGAGMTRVKDFISQQVDSYRPAYARADIDRPRSCVFIGTTNESHYLSDPTGARRFWPVKIDGKVKLEELIQDRDQLWAEARVMFESGEQWHPPREFQKTIEEQQSERYNEDDWTGLVQGWIDRNVGDEGFTTEDILGTALSIEPRFWDRSAQTRVGAILTRLGYAKKRTQHHGKRVSRYFPV